MIDVTIRGAGIFGLSVAWACAKRGAKVRVVDPNGVAAGASGGHVGALAPHVPENWNTKKAFQLESLLMAETWWAEIAEASGLDPGYARHGRLQPLNTDHDVQIAQARSEGAIRLWDGKAHWKVTDSPGEWAPFSRTGLWVRDTLSGRLHPRWACEALAKAVGGVDREAPDAGAVVWATGWQGLLELSEHFGQPIGNGVKGQSVLLKYKAADQPQIFVDSLHIVPHADGTVGIGSTSEQAFQQPDTTDERLDDLIARVRDHMPALADAPVIARWAGVRPRAKSRAPMLGAWPGRPGHFIANGGFKIGFGMAPKVADVMADLILEGRDKIPEDFRVQDTL